MFEEDKTEKESFIS